MTQTVKARPSKERFTLLYRLAQMVSFVLFHTLFPVRYHGVDKAQLDAPFMLIANHSCLLDPLVAGWQCKRYQIYFLGKKELNSHPLTKWLFEKLHMISVDRHNMDMAAVRACLKALKEGHPLGIFPEGTRHKEGVMQDLESGVAILALRANVPMLPAYISARPRLFRRVDCYYGDPIAMDAFAAGGVDKANCDKLLGVIRETYEDLRREHEKTLGKAY